jgi:hypothetical protein
LNEPLNLLEVEEVLPRQPDILRLGHAVLAPEVAAIGHRYAQRAQRPTVCVELHVSIMPVSV